MKKILFYVELYENFGLGNLIRTQRLIKFFHLNSNHNLFFSVDNNCNLCDTIKNDYAKVVNLNSLNSIYYDCVIYDSSKPKLNLLELLKKTSRKIIALDFFIYNQKIDAIINLHNHFKEQINQFKGELFSGPKYAIIDDNILKLNSSNNNNFINILITFGSEDPVNNTLKTLNHIKSLKYQS